MLDLKALCVAKPKYFDQLEEAEQFITSLIETAKQSNDSKISNALNYAPQIDSNPFGDTEKSYDEYIDYNLVQTCLKNFFSHTEGKDEIEVDLFMKLIYQSSKLDKATLGNIWDIVFSSITSVTEASDTTRC